jgi:F-type H+-transporting ATPase subunit epsilon
VATKRPESTKDLKRVPLHLEIVTPTRRVFEGDVDEVIVPGSEGEMGILPHHAPLISLLGQGSLRLKTGGQEEQLAIFGGFVQVRPDRVVVLAETADLGSEIDLERAHRARAEAEKMLEGGLVEEEDVSAARAALQRALIRIRIAESQRQPHRHRQRRPQEPPGE